MFLTAADALVATVAFFDCLGIALSAFEVWIYAAADAGAPYSLNDVETVLAHDERLRRTNGLWTLADRTELVEERVRRSFPVHERWAIAARAAQYARFIPFLRLFAVCNTLGYGLAREQGDIDVLVVASRGRLWTARFLLTGLLHLSRLRRHGTRVRRRICLSFFLACDALSVAGLALPDLDPYLAWWVGSVVPLADWGCYNDFVTANRPFVGRYRKQFPSREQPPLWPLAISHWSIVYWLGTIGDWLRQAAEWLLSGAFGTMVERGLRLIQRTKIKRSSFGRVREHSTSVVVSDRVLKFHESDRRADLRDAWLTKLDQLGVPLTEKQKN